MKVKAIAAFFGVEEDRYIKLGEILDVSEERAQRMVAKRVGEIIKTRRKRKEPTEDKAARATEDKGAE